MIPKVCLELVDSAVARVRGRLVPATCLERVPYKADGEILSGLLIATSTGLLLWDGASCRRVLPGFFYGLTRVRGTWYAFRQVTKRSGQILRFRIASGRVEDLSCVKQGLSHNIHQMDVWAGRLHLADTDANRIRVFEIETGGGLRFLRDVEPVGPARHGWKDPNYVHLNSLYRKDGRVFVMFHNASRKTQRKSEIAVLSDELRLQERIPTASRCAHNFVIQDGRWIYCDSLDGGLVVGEQRVEIGMMTRGLAVRGSQAVVGCSRIGARPKRLKGPGELVQVDLDRVEVVGRMRFEDVGAVHELRTLDGEDLGMSEAQ
jgi:hypothetical protein